MVWGGDYYHSITFIQSEPVCISEVTQCKRGDASEITYNLPPTLEAIRLLWVNSFIKADSDAYGSDVKWCGFTEIPASTIVTSSEIKIYNVAQYLSAFCLKITHNFGFISKALPGLPWVSCVTHAALVVIFPCHTSFLISKPPRDFLMFSVRYF